MDGATEQYERETDHTTCEWCGVECYDDCMTAVDGKIYWFCNSICQAEWEGVSSH